MDLRPGVRKEKKEKGFPLKGLRDGGLHNPSMDRHGGSTIAFAGLRAPALAQRVREAAFGPSKP
jgi:hypothetical protein